MLKREFSLYLDLVRFLAAVLVVVNHSNHRDITTALLPQLGHSAVMVFFVLSGFVIAYVTEARETDLKSYSVSRLARIYSVVPVALLTTLVADAIGQSIDPVFYQTVTTEGHGLLRLFSSFFLLNELWHISITTFSNVPYWSLNYEVWYYALFAMAVFLRGRRRLLLLCATALFLGPKILLLAPIWWLGVYLYRSRRWAALGEGGGWFLFVASLLLICGFHYFEVRALLGDWLRQAIGPSAYRELAYSKSFLSDYLLGLLVFANFAGFRPICHRFAGILRPAAPVIRHVAGYTFVLYLTHQPLIWLYKTLLDGNPDSPLLLVQIWVLVGLSVWLLGQVTERRKAQYIAMADWLVSRLAHLASRLRRTRGGAG